MTWSTVLPILTLVLGSVLSLVGGLLTETRRDRVTARREEALRAIVAAEQRRQSNRELLHRLQEALAALLNEMQVYWEEARLDQSWAEKQQPPSFFRAWTAVEILRVRLGDSELMGFVQGCVEGCLGVTSAQSQDEALSEDEKAWDGFRKANERVGDLLRWLDVT